MRFAFILLPLFSIVYCQGERLIDRWHTYDEIQAQLEEWDMQFGDNQEPSVGYPGSGIIYHLEEIGRSNSDDLPFWGVRLSYHADIKEDEPRVLILGQCHAEEIYGVEISMQLIYMFLNPQLYVGTYFSYMRTILQTSEVWIVPTYNPEGLQVVHGLELDGNWLQDETYRKNRTDINLNGQFDFSIGVGNDSDGVDLNRNYDFNWFLGDGYWVPDPGCGSYYANFDYFRGPAPFSESEVRAVRDFAIGQNFLLSVAYHSSRSGCVSEEVIFPWEWNGNKTSPDYPVVSQLGAEIAGLVPNETGSGYYLAIPSVSRRGNAHDWFYTQTGCIQYLIETGTANIQPNNEYLITDTINRNIRGVFHLMNRAIGYGGQGEDDPLGADNYQVTGVVTDAMSGSPVSAIVSVPQMDGPMLKPRSTDEFGRYRRLLYPSTFQVNFIARGYDPQVHTITSSSSNTNILNVSMTPKPQYEFAIDLTAPDLFDGVAFVSLRDEIGAVDTITFIPGEDYFNTILPGNTYEITAWGTDDLFPKHYMVELVADTTLNIRLRWAGIVINESFDTPQNWSAANGFWAVQMGRLISQNSLLYDDNYQSEITSTPIALSGFSNLEIILDWEYEFEWEKDTGYVVILTDTNHFGVHYTDQQWTMHRDSFPLDNLSGTSAQITIGLKSDESLGYRGLSIDNLALWYEPAGDCPVADLNRDGASDILDVVSLVDAILNDAFSSYLYCTADVNGDVGLDILDIIYIIMIIIQP